jgi:hypothetical protein
VPVPVVQVRVVRVAVDQPRVAVPVRVRLARRVTGPMGVPVVRVVHVRVLVLVLVPLGQVEPDAQTHEPARDQEPERHRLALLAVVTLD